MAALPSAHSPLGASGAYRWLPEPWGGGCYGSVGLSQNVDSSDYDDGEFTKPGIAAHALAEMCMTRNVDAWTMIGSVVNTIDVDKEMADAVQVYLDFVRQLAPDRHQGNSWVERSFHCPTIHDLFYGTADFTYYDEATRTVHVTDYKHGAGIVVEAERNPQCLYYACGVLEDLDLWEKVDKVVVHIVQPRGWHWAGPVRSWGITTPELEDWLIDILVPGMNKALVSRETRSGDHCRFCPVRGQACPQLLADQDEMWGIVKSLWPADLPFSVGKDTLKELKKMLEKSNAADKLTNEQVGRSLDLFEVMKIIAKACNATGFNRITQAGATIPGWKTVAARTNREFKSDAEPAAIKKFGKKRAFTEPKLKSPAEIDKLPGGTEFTAEWAFKPDGGLTLAQADDNRPATKTRDLSSMFQPVDKKAKKA